MSAKRFLAGLALAFVVVAPATAAPLEAYGGLPSIETIEISPDGSKLAVVISNGDQRTLGIKLLSDGSMQSYAAGPAKIRGLDWVGSDTLIVTTSQTGQIMDVSAPRREHFLGFQLNLATKKFEPLLQNVMAPGQTGTHFHDKNDDLGASLNVLAGPPEVRTLNGVPTLFLRGITFPGGWGVLTLFRVNPKTGEPELVEVGTRETDDIVLGQDGSAVARTNYDADSGRWVLKLQQAGGWKVSRTVVAKTDPPFLVGLGRDGQSVIVGEPSEAGINLREVSAAGWGEPLDVRDPDGMVFDPGTSRLIGLYALVGDEDRYTFFDPQDQGAWNAVRSAFKGDRVLLKSWSQDRKKIVVLVDSAAEGPAYALVDLATKRAT